LGWRSCNKEQARTKHRFHASKGSGERGSVLNRGKSYLATALLPRLTLVSIPHHRAESLIGSKKDVSDHTSNLAGDSCDGIHMEIIRSLCC
jgi:hypothetical protein